MPTQEPLVPRDPGPGDPQAGRLPRRPARLVLGVGLVVALVAAAGCGGDDDDSASNQGTGTETGSGQEASTTTADAAGADTAAYCDAELAVVTAGAPNIDYTAGADQMAQTIVDFVTTTLQPKVTQLEPVLPDELADEFTTLNGALQQVEAGDLAATDNPDVVTADETVHAYDMAHCGWTSQPVTASEYSFQGIPTTMPAGVTSFEMTNSGTELHELVLLRKNDGVTQSFEQILSGPPDQVLQQVTLLGMAGPVGPGDDDRVTADLTAGDYLALDSVPVGTTDLNNVPQAPPHFTQGMASEFTVS